MDETQSHTGQIEPVVNPDFSVDKLAKLAHELANETLNPTSVCAAYGITVAQYKQHIEPNPYFKRVYEAALIEWASTTSTVKRIKIRSAAMLEAALLSLSERMVDKNEALPAAIQAATMFAKLAGAGEEKPQVGSGERFTISINIGSKKIEQVIEPTIDVTPAPKELEKPHD